MTSKSNWWLVPILLLVTCGSVGPSSFSAEPPKPAVAVVKASKQAIPQSLLDALALCERDREAIVTAQATVDAAAKAKAKAVLDCENDYKALVVLLESLYGPGPTPIPPVPPTPPVPPPIPPPPVPPPPPPPPVVQKVQIITVEQTEQSTPAFARIRNSVAIRNWAENGSHVIFFIDADSLAKSGGTWKPWADRVVGKPLPYVFVATKDGSTILSEGPCPTTEATFLAFVQTYGGKGSTCSAMGCPLIQGAK